MWCYGTISDILYCDIMKYIFIFTLPTRWCSIKSMAMSHVLPYMYVLFHLFGHLGPAILFKMNKEGEHSGIASHSSTWGASIPTGHPFVLATPLLIQLLGSWPGKAIEDVPSPWGLAPTWDTQKFLAPSCGSVQLWYIVTT